MSVEFENEWLMRVSGDRDAIAFYWNMPPGLYRVLGCFVKQGIARRLHDFCLADTAIGTQLDIQRHGAFPATSLGNEGIGGFGLVDEIRPAFKGFGGRRRWEAGHPWGCHNALGLAATAWRRW